MESSIFIKNIAKCAIQCHPIYEKSEQSFPSMPEDIHNNNNNNNDNNNNNKLKISIALFPDVIKERFTKSHIKLNTILNGEKLKKNEIKVIR